MKRLSFLALALLLIGESTLAAPVNVAEGAVVTLNGTYGVLRAGSGWFPHPVDPASSLTDGIFRPAATTWNDGSVWWDAFESSGASAANSIEIDLGASFDISGFIVQADDNDTYLVETWNGASWIAAWDVPAVGGFGLQTRPNPADQTEIFNLAAPVSTDRLRFTGTDGDGFFSVSEIQAFADVPVPEPSSLVLVALGLLGLGAREGRKPKRRTPSPARGRGLG
jgi:hypothetical protein